MTDKKVKKLQEKAQAAAYDLFNTLTRMGIYRTHMVLGDRLTGEFEALTVVGMYEAALLSDIDEVNITLRPRPENLIETDVTSESTTEKEVSAEEPSGD